jgi:hypothetical protein
MERRVPVRLRLAAPLAALLLLCAGAALADHEVVLVTSAQSKLNTPSILDVRKVYLGITVRQGSHTIRGLRNLSDPKADSIFVQSVMAMSERAYERRLIDGSLRFGRPRPAEYDSQEALVAEILASPDTITYMWREDAERLQQLKVLAILWHAY